MLMDVEAHGKVTMVKEKDETHIVLLYSSVFILQIMERFTAAGGISLLSELLGPFHSNKTF